MKAKLRIIKDGKILHTSSCEINSAEDFGRACADLWHQLRRIQLDRETSIGAAMEHITDEMSDQLDGVSISIAKV
jgi:hypothetical protein